MTNEIGEIFLLYRSAGDIWNDAKEVIKAKTIRQQSSRLKQLIMVCDKENSQSPNSTILTRQWQQLDVFEDHK